MTEELAAKLDDLFERIVFAKAWRPGPQAERRHTVDPMSFDELDVMTFIDARIDKTRIFLLSGEDKPRKLIHFDPAVIWPFKVQAVTHAAKDGWAPGALHLASTESCDTRVARAWGATIYAPRMVLARHAVIQNNGVAATCCGVYAYVGKRWVTARRRLVWERVPHRPDDDKGYVPHIVFDRPEFENEDHNPIVISQSLALTQRYEWSVCIGLGNGPKLRLGSDPTGLRAMFRDRDKEEGRDRRAALRHWVQAHWRQKRRDPADLAWVRAYLRGRTAFRWYGYDCVIRPSTYDLEQLARSAA